jgi:hypothetical protein
VEGSQNTPVSTIARFSVDLYPQDYTQIGSLLLIYRPGKDCRGCLNGNPLCTLRTPKKAETSQRRAVLNMMIFVHRVEL